MDSVQIKIGDRVRLRAFEDGTCGLVMYQDMTKAIGKEDVVRSMDNDGITFVCGWYWPVSALEPA